MSTYRWSRTASFGLKPQRDEIWHLHHEAGQKCFNVKARFSKAVNLARIKAKHSFGSEVLAVKAKRKYYDDLNQFIDVDICQVCRASIKDSELIMPIWSVNYRRCLQCSHTYADRRPRDELISQYYEDTSDKAKQYYLHEDEIQLRIEELYLPKIDWLIEAYTDNYGRPPRHILDIGAGSGHFLAAAQSRGLEVAGLEIDSMYRDFAQEHFNITLVKSAEELQGSFDIITSFNVVEHVLNLDSFLQLHQQFSSSKVLVAAETPNFESFTIHLQQIFPERLRGYFAPYEHVQLFTQSSLATALYLSGYGVTHYWIFGQDTREFVFQLTADIGGDGSKFISEYFNSIQQGIDQASFGDLMLFAAVPLQDP